MWLILLKIEFYDFICVAVAGAGVAARTGGEGVGDLDCMRLECEVTSMFTVSYSGCDTPK